MYNQNVIKHEFKHLHFLTQIYTEKKLRKETDERTLMMQWTMKWTETTFFNERPYVFKTNKASNVHQSVFNHLSVHLFIYPTVH